MPTKPNNETLWIKVKSQYKLAKMFEEEDGRSHYKAPLAFENWSMYIPTSAMGKVHKVTEVHTYPNERLFKFSWASGEWWISERFCTRKFYVLEVDCE